MKRRKIDSEVKMKAVLEGSRGESTIAESTSVEESQPHPLPKLDMGLSSERPYRST
jgi:hypothetical protein